MSRASLSRVIILGVVPRGDQRVEAADGAAGDGDEDERKELAGEDRPGAVDERGDGRHRSGGSTSRMPSASSRIVPIFMKVER